MVAHDEDLDSEPGEQVNVFFNPDMQHQALRRQNSGGTEAGPQTGNVGGLNNDIMVGRRGLEPRTYGLKVRSSAN